MTSSDHALRAARILDPYGRTDDSALGDWLAACPDDVPVPTVEFLDQELSEAADHADPDAADPVVAVAHALAVYLAHHPYLVGSSRDQLLTAAVTHHFEGPVPERIWTWLDAEQLAD